MQESSSEPRVFATTRWSLVLIGSQLESGEQQAREALTELCRTYWRPIFSYVCRRGYSSEDAQDLTQDFFLMILETNWLRHADESRGRFRSFLLKSLQNFLGHTVERRQARKRGGDVQFVSWDEWMAEAQAIEGGAGPGLVAAGAGIRFALGGDRWREGWAVSGRMRSQRPPPALPERWASLNAERSGPAPPI
jgi:hypothetical protein